MSFLSNFSCLSNLGSLSNLGFIQTFTERKSLNIVIKHVFICSNPYIYTTVVQEVYNRDRSPEVDDVEVLAAAATNHLDLLKQKDEAKSSFIIEKTVRKLQAEH